MKAIVAGMLHMMMQTTSTVPVCHASYDHHAGHLSQPTRADQMPDPERERRWGGGGIRPKPPRSA
jgi:hypothetical protein